MSDLLRSPGYWVQAPEVMIDAVVHFTSFNLTYSPMLASPDATNAKWTIQKS